MQTSILPTAAPFFSVPFFASLPLPLAGAGLVCVGIDLKGNAEDWWAAALPWVTTDEQTRARRFHQRMDVVRHLVGRALIRVLLAREFGAAALSAEFVANPWGKPTLPGSGFEFSISHSGNAVWVALCRGFAVGIDVERADTVTDPHALADVFHPTERAELLLLPAVEAQCAFLRCWTRKEAVVKALGEGLSRPFSSFCVRTDECASDWLVEVPEAKAEGWTSADLPVSTGYHASVAVMAPCFPITCHLVKYPG